MAQILTYEQMKAADYRGLASIYEYTNDDGALQKWNCGQAAAATLLTHLGQFEPNPQKASEIMSWIENNHPPDVAGGWFGSSRRRVTRICRSRGVELDEINGIAELRRELDRGNPVIMMLGVHAGKFWRFDLPGGHWAVAYGYDSQNLYLTNWGEPCPWDDFGWRWRSMVSRIIQMSERGLVARPTRVE
jgi:hypothetical protein